MLRLWSVLTNFTTQAESTTVYSEKVEVFKKWKMGFPLTVENLVVPSPSITFFVASTPNLSHKLVFSHLHIEHSPHSPLNIGTTMSPSSTSLTPSPTLSTILYIYIYPSNWKLTSIPQFILVSSFSHNHVVHALIFSMFGNMLRIKEPDLPR